jgi:hypothetical protein
MILLISASWVARITGVSHRCWFLVIFNVKFAVLATLSVQYRGTHHSHNGAQPPHSLVSLPQTEALQPLKLTLPAPQPLPPSSWTHSICFLSLWIGPLWMPQTSAITHLSFCPICPGPIHVTAFSVPRAFLWLNNIPLHDEPEFDSSAHCWCTFGLFPHFDTLDYGAVNICEHIFVWTDVFNLVGGADT